MRRKLQLTYDNIAYYYQCLKVKLTFIGSNSHIRLHYPCLRWNELTILEFQSSQ